MPTHDFKSRCPTCPGTNCVVRSSGPVPCSVLFVGERPGPEENYKDLPWIGKAGQEVNEHYLPLAGLSRPDVRFTNAVRCWEPGNRKLSDKELFGCANYHLAAEIELTDPGLVVLMGGPALRLITGPDKLDLQTHHGYPFKVELFGRERWVFVTYNPAFGLRDTRRIGDLREDFSALWRVLGASDRGKCQPVDKWLGKESYQLGGTVPGVSEYALKTLRLDTETLSGDDGDIGMLDKLWSVQLTYVKGTGRLYRADNHEDMQYVQELINLCEVLSIHNAPFDLKVLERAGFSFDERKVVDTMQIAYHLGMAQGLKPLAYRLAGMKMRTFTDLVTPASVALVTDWLCKAMDLTPDVPELGKKGQPLKSKNQPNPLGAEVRRILRSLLGNDDYSPWKRWAEVKAGASAGGDDKGEAVALLANWLEDELGPMPKAGIDKVELSEAVWYGCRDTDASARVEEELDKQARRVGDEVKERDWDEVAA